MQNVLSTIVYVAFRVATGHLFVAQCERNNKKKAHNLGGPKPYPKYTKLQRGERNEDCGEERVEWNEWRGGQGGEKAPLLSPLPPPPSPFQASRNIISAVAACKSLRSLDNPPNVHVCSRRSRRISPNHAGHKWRGSPSWMFCRAPHKHTTQARGCTRRSRKWSLP